MTRGEHIIRPIGVVRSPLTSREGAPKQEHEGAPEAWLLIEREYLEGMEGVEEGQELLVLTWLHRASRDVLRVHPKQDPTKPLKGVFATRSADRPNPIGLHRVRVLEIADGVRLRVDHLEALDGTPIVDLKPVRAGRSS